MFVKTSGVMSVDCTLQNRGVKLLDTKRGRDEVAPCVKTRCCNCPFRASLEIIIICGIERGATILMVLSNDRPDVALQIMRM